MTQGIGGLQSVLQCYNAKSSIAFLPFGSLRRVVSSRNASDRPFLHISKTTGAFNSPPIDSKELEKSYTMKPTTFFRDKFEKT